MKCLIDLSSMEIDDVSINVPEINPPKPSVKKAEALALSELKNVIISIETEHHNKTNS